MTFTVPLLVVVVVEVPVLAVVAVNPTKLSVRVCSDVVVVVETVV